jgi:hypothetical protein
MKHQWLPVFCNGVAIVAFLALACVAGPLSAGDAPLSLENNDVRVDFDPACGTIQRVLDKSSGIELAPPREMAENFRLLLLLRDNKTVTILGKTQKLTSVDRSPSGLALHWAGPLTDTAGGKHKIAVTMNVELAANQVAFRLHVDNGTEFKIREVLYPRIGGLGQFAARGKPADGVLWAPTSHPWVKKIDGAFGSPQFAYPGQLCMSFTCIESVSAGKSLYFAAHDTIARYKTYEFDQPAAPGAKSDHVELFAGVRHYPFTPPGKSFDGSTVVLRVVDGDWHAAGKLYRTWFEKTFGICKPSQSWVRRESFFQITMFGLPEGTVCLRFKDIPAWAADAKRFGVNAVQISGWQHGGHDNGYPDYTPDPHFGTWQELADGIKACHAMGMKVYFFVNYQPVMLDTQWYKKELVNYREWGDANGAITWNAGWPMGTLWGRMGNPKRMTWANPAFPAFRRIIVDQFAKLAEIGADGVHVDKMFPTALDYNPNLPMSPDTAGWEGAIILTKEIFAACRKHNPDWAMSFECNWDRMLQFAGATWWTGNQLITRKVFPENAEAQMISSAYDYLGVNNLVRDGHVVMVAPRNFCASMGWKPWHGLSNYIKEVKRIRDQLQDTVFFGEPLEHEGVKLSAAATTGVEYSVFRNTTSGRRVCIFTNARMTAAKQALQGFDGSRSSEVRVWTPFAETKVVILPAEIVIPPERIVFVEER